MYKLTMQRIMKKRSGDDKIKLQAEWLVDRALGAGRGKTWKYKLNYSDPFQQNGMWVFRILIDLEKISGQKNTEAEYKQFEEIKAMLIQSGQAQKFQGQNWVLIGGEADQGSPPLQTHDSIQDVITDLNAFVTSIMDVREVQNIGIAKKWSELIVPDELLGPESDKHLGEHPAWKDLYGVNPQIRVLLSNVKRAQETDGESRNHICLWGHSSCGKTTAMFGLEKMFGQGSVLKLDATSTTKAGLEKLFFSELKEVPPIVIMEEAEKADPEALKIWLGALDDRGEIRKINFRVNQLRSIKVLFICSVNNKSLFDKMMGSDGSEAGALSSRCVSQIYFPRPNETVLQQILEKEIREKGGKKEWIAPAILLAQKLGITDPRVVKSYLSGGDRLISGQFQKDCEILAELQKSFRHE